MLGHGNGQQRYRQRDANPEAPRHGAQFGIIAIAGGRRHRFQRHAADRAVARLLAHDLRVHRAGPQDLAGGGHKGPRGGDAVARRIGREFFAATGAAEEVAVAGVVGAVAGLGRIDEHAADRIMRRNRRRRRMVAIEGWCFCRCHQVLPYT
jgi:hypothetical protein